MESRDLDRWARLIASSCSRRRTLQALGAGALALGLGRRGRFDALAADLGCCKCSGTLRCELDVASYGECVAVCGPRKQAIFAPNYTCTRGNSLSKVCKSKRRATGFALLAGAPGVYDLAFVDRTGAATIPGLAPETTLALFTAEAALEAGIVEEAGAAALYEEAVQVYHSRWRDADETTAVFSHLSQHLTAEAAAAWYEYVLPQLGPEGAETFDFELSGADAGALVRFAFPSQTQPGATITRLMALTLTGEFVNWFGIDAVDTIPDPELARTFAQAVIDALIDRPEQTASLAPYVRLLPNAAACLSALPVTATKRGPAEFQDEDPSCAAPTGTIRYPVWDGAFVPVVGMPADLIELNRSFLTGADRALNQTYLVGDQAWTISITEWVDPDVLANGGEVYFQRRDEVDAARGVIRQDLDLPHEGGGQWFCTAFVWNAGEQPTYAVNRLFFAPPFSVSLDVIQGGEPVADPSTWTAEASPTITGSLLPAIAAEGEMGLVDWPKVLENIRRDRQLPTFGSALDMPLQGDAVVAESEAVDPKLLRDFGATAATFGLSSALRGYTVVSGETLLTREAMEAALRAWADRATPGADKEEIVKLYFGEQEPLQGRIDRFATEDESATVEIMQWQYPDPPTREAWEKAPSMLGGWASGFDPAALSDPEIEGSGQIWEAELEEDDEVDDISYLLVEIDKLVVVATRTVTREGSADRSAGGEEWAREAFGTLVDGYDDEDWAGEVGAAVQDVTPWLPALDAQTQWYFHHYYGYVDGQPLPRFGDDPDRVAAENPWVQNALFGGYGLNSGLGALDVSFGVRSFADQDTADNYVAQVPSLMENDRSGIAWRPWDEFDPEFDQGSVDRYLVHAGTRTNDDGVPMVGVNVAVQDGTIVSDVGAFAPYTGDPGTFANLDPLADPNFLALAKGLIELVKAEAEARAASDVPRGYLPNPLELPASWQLPLAQNDDEEAATQYDPIAFVGNVAQALPDYGTTPSTFVFDLQHEGAVAALYGAEPPAGWLGLLRSAFFLPDPNAANGQGFGQSLYLKGHWFDTDVNAREWYLTGKPLVEAAGNGSYVDQTGEAKFGRQRTVWGTSFPTAEDPNVTIQRGVGWFRRGSVVVEATLDAYCTGAAGTGTLCAEGVVPYLVEELGEFLDDGLKAAETESPVTHQLPVLEDAPVVQVDVTQWGDEAIRRFGDTAEQQAGREEFGFDTNAHVTLQYLGSTDAGEQVAVFGNSWVTDSIIETQQLLREELARYVEESDARISAERADIPRLALSGEGWAITGNAFVFPQADGSKVGGVEVRAAKDTVLNTGAVVTPLSAETTAQDVADEFVRAVDATQVCPEGPRGPAGPGPNDVARAILVTVASTTLGLTPRDVIDAFATEDNEEAVEHLEEVLQQIPPDLDLNAGQDAAPLPLWERIDIATVYC